MLNSSKILFKAFSTCAPQQTPSFPMNFVMKCFTKQTNRRYSLKQGKITAANGKTYDMASAQDKEQMVNENLVYWIDTVRDAILEKDPTALISVGFFQPQTPNPSRIGDTRLAVTEPAIWQSQADFIDLHAYPGFELNLKQYVENFGIKDMQQKPILMGEFGAEVSRFMSSDVAIQRLINWQVESCQIRIRWLAFLDLGR